MKSKLGVVNKTTKTDNTKKLISNSLSGCEKSFETLVLNYQSCLYSFIYKMTYSKNDTEDIMQDVFIKVYKYLDKYDEKYSFSTWLFKIASNSCKNFLKKNAYNRQCKFDDLYELFIEDSVDIENEIINKEKYWVVLKIIDTLNYENKTALLLRQIKDLSYKDISNILNISEGSAKMKVKRAKKTVIEKYNQQNKEPEKIVI